MKGLRIVTRALALLIGLSCLLPVVARAEDAPVRNEQIGNTRTVTLYPDFNIETLPVVPDLNIVKPLPRATPGSVVIKQLSGGSTGCMILPVITLMQDKYPADVQDSVTVEPSIWQNKWLKILHWCISATIL